MKTESVRITMTRDEVNRMRIAIASECRVTGVQCLVCDNMNICKKLKEAMGE